ncbi:MAG: response regulator [Planctomycetota bacterium]
MTLNSREGEGTTFSLFLPATAEPVLNASPVRSTNPVFGASILVLEDELMVQRVYRGLLQRWGYDVEVVTDGADAVRRFADRREQGRPFDLLIMDLTIAGGVGGRQAITEILELDPSARAIVASGYTDDPAMVRFRDAGFAGALSKPFQPNDLACAISATLSEHGSFHQSAARSTVNRT